MRKVLSIFAACGPLLVGCGSAERSVYPLSRPYAPALNAAGSALFLQYPQFDQRIVARLPEGTKELGRWYPDRWRAGTAAVLDFAVDHEGLYVLLAAPGERSTLHVMPRGAETSAQRIPLSEAPTRLAWADGNRLLVGHFSAPGQGPLGLVSVLDVRKRAVVRTLRLAGACLDLVSGGERVFVLERLERRLGRADTLLGYGLASFDLATGHLLRRIALPAGPRQLVIGPTGLLYISFVSADGRHATDGTVGVFDSENLRLVDRLKLAMSVTRMAGTRQHLALTTLKANGDAYFSLLDRSHSTVFDYRLSQLTTDQLLVIGAVAYIPLRQQHAIERIDLRQRRRLPRLALKEPGYRDVIGLLRAERLRTGASSGQGDHAR